MSRVPANQTSGVWSAFARAAGAAQASAAAIAATLPARASERLIQLKVTSGKGGHRSAVDADLHGRNPRKSGEGPHQRFELTAFAEATALAAGRNRAREVDDCRCSANVHTAHDRSGREANRVGSARRTRDGLG